MKKYIYVLLICSLMLAAALIFGGCGFDDEPMAQEASAEFPEQAEPAIPVPVMLEHQPQPLDAQELETHDLPEVAEQESYGATEPETIRLPIPDATITWPADMPKAPPVDPTGVWGYALEEYLAQFLPIFHNARFIETYWWSRWESDFSDFVERLPDDSNDPNRSRDYGVYFLFRNPMTGQRLEVNDVPYITHYTGTWYDYDGVRRQWPFLNISYSFELLYLDDSDIPALVIIGHHPLWFEPTWPTTLHLFRDGVFEFAGNISLSGASFFRSEDGRIFVGHFTPVAGMIHLCLLSINGEAATKRVLNSDGWTRAIFNYLTGEEFLQLCPEDGSAIRRDYWAYWEDPDFEGNHFEIRISYYLGFQVRAIEPQETMHEHLMERVSRRLRDEGLVG